MVSGQRGQHHSRQQLEQEGDRPSHQSECRDRVPQATTLEEHCGRPEHGEDRQQHEGLQHGPGKSSSRSVNGEEDIEGHALVFDLFREMPDEQIGHVGIRIGEQLTAMLGRPPCRRVGHSFGPGGECDMAAESRAFRQPPVDHRHGPVEPSRPVHLAEQSLVEPTMFTVMRRLLAHILLGLAGQYRVVDERNCVADRLRDIGFDVGHHERNGIGGTRELGYPTTPRQIAVPRIAEFGRSPPNHPVLAHMFHTVPIGTIRERMNGSV